MEGMILVFLLLGMTCAQVTRTNNHFLRFDDSFERDSDENLFVSGNNNGVLRTRFDHDDSDERSFFRAPATTTNHFNVPRQNFASQSRNTFNTPNRNTFASSTSNTIATPSRNALGTSNFFNRFDDDDSDERFFSGTNTFKTNVNNRNRFDDSRENFRKANSLSFSNTQNTRNRFDVSDEVTSFRNSFNRNTNSFQTKKRIDSVEDLFEDLFDDDLNDRVRAQNTLSSLGFGNQANNRVVSFNTKLGSDRLNSNVRSTNNPILSSTNSNRFKNNQFATTSPVDNRFASNREVIKANTKFNPIDHFRVSTGSTPKRPVSTTNQFSTSNQFGTTSKVGTSNQFGTTSKVGTTNKIGTTNKFGITNQFGTTNQFETTNQFGSNNARPNNNGAFSFGTSLGNPDRFNTPKQSSSVSNTNRFNTFNTNNRFSTNNNQLNKVPEKKSSGVPLSNSIKSDPFSSVMRSEFFPNTPGFNWPGGNGYYVRMSTGNSKPFSYFVKYDD